MELSSRQKACCLKVVKHKSNPAKAAKYAAALIGSGAAPEEVPELIRKIWVECGMQYNKITKIVSCRDRYYLCSDYWEQVQEVFPSVNLATEMLFNRAFEEQEADWA